jgi:enoyl-CoA hydratase
VTGLNEYETVRIAVENHVATVTIDRPPVNAISIELYRDLGAVFREFNEHTDEIRAVVLTGAGRCFCAGRDLKQSETTPWDERSAMAKASYSAVYHCAVPVIAAVNGPAMGAGFVTSIVCDMIVASERAVFALPEIDAGLNMSTATVLRGLNQQQARYLAFTAAKVGPDELFRYGLVHQVVPHEELLPAATKLARVIAGKSPVAMRAAKEVANNVEAMFGDFELAYRAIEAPSSKLLFDTEDRREAGQAFREKRPPVFKGR